MGNTNHDRAQAMAAREEARGVPAAILTEATRAASSGSALQKALFEQVMLQWKAQDMARFLRKTGGDVAAAEDIYQAYWERMYKGVLRNKIDRLSRVRWRAGDFASIDQFNRELKHGKGRRHTEEGNTLDGVPARDTVSSPEKRAASNQAGEWLATAMEVLPPDRFMLVYDHHVMGLTVRELVAKYDIEKRGTVMSRLFYARKKVEKAFFKQRGKGAGELLGEDALEMPRD